MRTAPSMTFDEPRPVRAAGQVSGNPIAHAEADHLRRYTAAHPRRRWVIVVLLLLAGAAFAANASLLLEDTGLGVLFRDADNLLPVLSLVAVTLVLHLMALFRLSMMAGESIVREKRGSTWETLIVTGMPAQRFVSGKILGVLRVVWREWLLLAAVRALLCVGLGATILGAGSFSFTAVSAEMVRFPVLQVLMAVALIVIFTGVNLLFTAVVGVAASLIGRTTSPGGTTATALRMGSLVTVTLLVSGGALAYIYFGPGFEADFTQAQQDLLMVLGYASFSLIDNGTVVTGLMASPYSHYGGLDLLMCLLALGVYLLLTVGFYRLAVALARRQGMS